MATSVPVNVFCTQRLVGLTEKKRVFCKHKSRFGEGQGNKTYTAVIVYEREYLSIFSDEFSNDVVVFHAAFLFRVSRRSTCRLHAPVMPFILFPSATFAILFTTRYVAKRHTQLEGGKCVYKSRVHFRIAVKTTS